MLPAKLPTVSIKAEPTSPDGDEGNDEGSLEEQRLAKTMASAEQDLFKPLNTDQDYQSAEVIETER